ncbi:MAG: hypothetical protein ACFFD3_10465 [Candidatus Thorarchaeota archaeon]
MVSRSLEKMILIAIGLTTVVIIGVPVLIYAMETLTNASQLEMAENFADSLHNATNRVDMGLTNHTYMQVSIPQYVSVSASGNTLTIAFTKDGGNTYSWSNTYTHPVSLSAPPGPGIYTLTIVIEDGELLIVFTPMTV